MGEQSIIIRKLSTEDLDQYNELLRYAFQVTEKTLLERGLESDDIRKEKFSVLENAHVLGCFDGDALISQFAVYPMKMNVYSEILSIGFITSVATYPEYSGRGLMSRLMKASLIEMRKRGQSLALLYPYSIPLYRKRGWEIISDKMTWRVPDASALDVRQVPGYVRRVAEDSPDLIDLHGRFAKQTHGCLFRNDLAWGEYWRWDVDDTTVAIYYNFDDVPMGYMVYLIDADIMYIKEMVYLNTEAKYGLFHYIAAHDSMVDEVRGNNYSGEAIAFALPDSDIEETIRPYIMGRIIDFEDFIRQYQFNSEIKGITLTLHITDQLLEWNNKSYTIAINNGKGHLVSQPSNYEASLSIGTLTTLLLGYKRAPELHNLQRISANEKTIQLLDNILIRKKPYISDYL